MRLVFSSGCALETPDNVQHPPSYGPVCVLHDILIFEISRFMFEPTTVRSIIFFYSLTFRARVTDNRTAVFQFSIIFRTDETRFEFKIFFSVEHEF